MNAPVPARDGYDFIFAGGGLAGLSLAWQIAHSPLHDRSMLVVDCDDKHRDDRTFSFWSNRPGPFDPAACRAWDRLAFHAPGFAHTASLGRYRYQTIRGLDFYRMARRELAAYPQVTFLQGRISDLHEASGGAALTVDGQEYTGRWAFDSRFRPAELGLQDQPYQYLKMAFRGWDVEAGRDVFDPQVATLMDFRTRPPLDAAGDRRRYGSGAGEGHSQAPRRAGVRFFYVLPFDARHALVEYTLFTPDASGLAEAGAALEHYLHTAFRLHPGMDCQVTPREAGSLLITDQPFPRQAGNHILSTGLWGGRLKPSTGYAFTRIQRDSEAILRSLLRHGHPFDLPASLPLYNQMDSIMLEIMRCHPEHIPGIFSALFGKNPIERVLRFLDEDASLGEIRRMIATLSPGLFLKILARRSIAPHVFLRSLVTGS